MIKLRKFKNYKNKIIGNPVIENTNFYLPKNAKVNVLVLHDGWFILSLTGSVLKTTNKATDILHLNVEDGAYKTSFFLNSPAVLKISKI